MTALAVAQKCAKRLQIASPSAFVASTDNNIILLLQMLEEAAQKIRNEFEWPELQKEHTFTLSTSTANYALPTDMNRLLFETSWNRTQALQLIGPVDPVEWQEYKSGNITSLPRQRFRVKGWVTNQFYVDPTPTSTENGQTCALEYITESVIRPKTWVASTSWSGMQYCSYNGNIYDRGGTGAGSTGTTAPTHTSGAVSDGSISWTFLGTPFETFNHDNDELILNEDLVIDQAIWRFKQERGLDFEDFRAQAEENKELAKTFLQSAEVISVRTASTSPSIFDGRSYPQGSYGL